MKMQMSDKKSKKAIIIAIITAITALVIASCSVFAWFMLADRNTAGDIGLTVVGSANIDLSVSIGGSGSGNLTFDDVVPGSMYDMKLTLRNYSTQTVHFNLFFKDLVKTVYHYKPNVEPIPTNGTPYVGVDMLDVFAVSSEQLAGLTVEQNGVNLYQNFAKPVYFNTICDDLRNKVTLLQGFPLPGNDDTEAEVNTSFPGWYNQYIIMKTGFSETTITFRIQFMNKILDAKKVEIIEANLGDEKVNININIFQRQQFFIRVLQVEEVSSTTF